VLTVVCVVSPLLQINEYGGTPPEGVVVMLPSQTPLHVIAFGVDIVVNKGGSVT